MKKIAALTILSLSFVAASYAQDTKNTPVPPHTKNKVKNSLMKESDSKSTTTPDNLATLKVHKQDGSFQKTQPYDGSQGKYDIKKTTFPKTKGKP